MTEDKLVRLTLRNLLDHTPEKTQQIIDGVYQQMNRHELAIKEMFYFTLDDRMRPPDGDLKAALYRWLDSSDLFLGLSGERVTGIFWLVPGQWSVCQLVPWMTTGTNQAVFQQQLRAVTAWAFNHGMLKLQIKLPLTVTEDIGVFTNVGYEVAGRLRAEHLLGGKLEDMLLLEAVHDQQERANDDAAIQYEQPTSSAKRAGILYVGRKLWGIARKFLDRYVKVSKWLNLRSDRTDTTRRLEHTSTTGD